MHARTEFVLFASQPGANVSTLARHFGISRTTAYKWLGRYQREGRPGLSPQRTSAEREAQVLT